MLPASSADMVLPVAATKVTVNPFENNQAG
jgi:hypothetical protein